MKIFRVFIILTLLPLNSLLRKKKSQKKRKLNLNQIKKHIINHEHKELQEFDLKDLQSMDRYLSKSKKKSDQILLKVKNQLRSILAKRPSYYDSTNSFVPDPLRNISVNSSPLNILNGVSFMAAKQPEESLNKGYRFKRKLEDQEIHNRYKVREVNQN